MYLHGFSPEHATPSEEIELRDLLQNQAPAFRTATGALAGKTGVKLVNDILDDMSRTPRLTRRIKGQLIRLLEILSLEHVHDFDRPDAKYFAGLNPSDPIVEEICLLADGLRFVLRKAGLSLPDTCAEYA